MSAPKPPRWFKETIWLFNAWFSILLPVVGILCLWRGKGVGTGLENIGMGLLNLYFAYLSRADRPTFKR